ncbi:cyclic nucleotide-binding protein [Dechloromonas denitrificans]|uniref:Cyclic nucleotide-binding protein n=2 Tax=Dechloromonas denitrificans TaxID=281362 RepID=A0A133XDX8_9RHOO|nr:cyclic nucleotide-binding protein [Dechloromonas denitrificans]
MLVALPASIAFGVTIYAAIAPSYAAIGALAGIIGATVIGLVASTLGGTDRLISAPCAPAAAVLSAFAIELVGQGIDPNTIVLLLVLLGVLAGIVQLLLGFIGVGRLIKYIPYPVVSGYLSGVGLIIIGSQIPKFVGAAVGTRWWEALLAPWSWDWRALAIGTATVIVAVAAPKITKKVPGTILGIVAGLLTYFALAIQEPKLWEITGNPLVIGPLGAARDGYFAAITERWHDIGDLHLSQIASLFGSALTLAALLSIDTLKTCVVIDQLTRTQHDSNRELVAQGIANISSAAVGGTPGAGTMGASLVNLNSGAQTRVSGVMEGVLSLIAALIFGSFLAWLPVATLAGILIVIGIRMLDREPLRFIESRATVFDFAVVLAVVVVALTIGLIAASAVGVAMAIILFVREQIGGSVVRHKVYANQMSSTWYRPEAEMRIIEQKGNQAVIFELQGSLFFGTTQQLYSELEPELGKRNYVILDLKRVQSVDVTAAHLLHNVRQTLQERGAMLLFSGVREKLPNGRNLREFLEQTGVVNASDDSVVRVFPELDAAIEWVEDHILGEVQAPAETETPIELQEMDLFSHRKDETLKDLETRMEQRTYRAGETIYAQGAAGDEIFWIRRGTVRIFAPLGAGRSRHIASFSRGDFFGGLAFLDNRPRGNDAVALTETEVYVLSREQFDLLAEEHKKLAFSLITAIARTLAIRLRHADTELTMLQEY